MSSGLVKTNREGPQTYCHKTVYKMHIHSNNYWRDFLERKE